MDDNKKLYELWWEYLKRSKNFRIFCDVLVEYPDPETAFLGKMSILPFVPDLLPSPPEKVMFNELLLWMNYKKFGDVFRTNFDDWWKSKQSDNSYKIVEDLEEIIERESCFFVGYCAKVFKVAGINDENIIELLHKYIRIEKDYKFIKIRISAKDKDIRNSVSRIISAVKKKHTHQPSVLKKYLLVYDGRNAGKSDDEIASAVFDSVKTPTGISYKEPRRDQIGEKEFMAQKQVSDYLRDYERFAEQIIKNVERGNFPGEFRNQK